MRFSVLDALRGICALIVVIFHIEIMANVYAGVLHGNPFFEHGFLFVDFFFVLSGFVLTHTYASKISDSKDFGVFVIRRFGRVYPLHFLFLLLFIGLEAIKLYGYSRGIRTNALPFHGEYSVGSIFTNLLLVQALGVQSSTTWNQPSWSISVEFYTYIVFALCCLLLRKNKQSLLYLSLVIAGFSAAILFMFSRYYIHATYDYAIFRCFLGFFVGTATYIVTSKVRTKIVGPRWLFLLIEAGTIAGCVAFVYSVGTTPLSLAAPIVFALVVAVFSLEKGAISAALSTRAFRYLGEISYTLYIGHAFVLMMITRALHVLQQKTPYISTLKYTPHHYQEMQFTLMVPLSYRFSNVVVIGILLTVIGLSAVVNRWIEIPSRDYFNRLSKRLGRRPEPQTRTIALDTAATE